MWNNIRYILLTAQRDSIFSGLVIAIIFGCYIAFFLGGAALDEGAQMALVYAGGISRIITILGLIIFVAFHIRRSFENKEIDQMIVRPISRAHFIISYWLGFSLVAFFFVMFTAFMLYLLPVLQDSTPPTFFGLFYWSLSLFCESVIVVSLTMAASLILRSTVVAVLLCIGFYVLSRMMGFMLILVTRPGAYGPANAIFKQISKLVPRMDFFAKTEWLIYGIQDWNQVYLFLEQGAIYTFLLLTVAVIDFQRKQF